MKGQQYLIEPDHSTIKSVFSSQQAAFQKNPYLSVTERRSNLRKLLSLITDNKDSIISTISDDFGYRSPHETELLEIFPSLQQIKYAISHVKKWMRPDRKPASIWFLPAQTKIIKQPLGVIGIIVPWNYPLLLTVGPMVSALAAGNRVMVKMSESVPKFGQLFSKLCSAAFNDDYVAIINGGIETGKYVSSLPFDHLLFTGSKNVGKKVMAAASRNLTPVTLELGGKSPAIIAPDFPIKTAAKRIAVGKCVNAGQTCIAPDYVLLPNYLVNQFIKEIRNEVKHLYPDGVTSKDFSSIIDRKHYNKLTQFLKDAKNKGAEVYDIMKNDSPVGLKFGLKLVNKVNNDMIIMKEEIFGPILPLVTYNNLEEAFDIILQLPRPLAMYYFDYDKTRIRNLLTNQIAGGVTINDTLLHITQDSLPFGGVGESGMGHYHGEYGFHTFSKRKGVFHQTRINGVGLMNPPFGKIAETLLNFMTK